MKLLKTIPLIIFIAINLFLIVAMNFCAYTSLLPPQDFPGFSYFGLMFPVFLVANLCFVPFWLIFKWKLTALPVAGMLLCAGGIRAYAPFNVSSTPPEGCLKVLSYNVMAFGDEKTFGLEKNPILRYVLDSDADILCLQEARKNFVDRALAQFDSLYPYNSLELTPDNYLACFSRYPILSVTRIDYPSDNNRSFAYEVLVGEDTLLVINNHLESYRLSREDKDDYKSIIVNYQHPEANDTETKYQGLTEKLSWHDSIRGLQVDSVAAFIEQNQGRPMVVCGDFNATPISYSHYRLTRLLNDAYTRTGNGPGLSYNRSGMYFRLDHILVSSNVAAYGAKVDRSISVSDHYPIYCFIKLEDK